MVVGERRGIGGIGTWIGQWKRMKDRNHGWGLWIGDEMVDDDGRTELWRRKFPLPTQIRGLPQVLITPSSDYRVLVVGGNICDLCSPFHTFDLVPIQFT